MKFELTDLPWDAIGSPWSSIAFFAIIYLAKILINIAFSAGVYIASKDRAMVLAPRIIWTLATLFGGVFVAVAYWVVHHSGLSDNKIIKKNIYQE